MHLLLALITIAAASDLQPVLPRLIAQFEAKTGHTVQTTFGSSGHFLAQITNGAPFDVFLSADADYPKQLESAGLAEPRTRMSYATGALVLWTRTGSRIEIARGLEALTLDQVRRIAIANPEHAPYGRAAVAALRAAGLYDRVRAKFVMGENVSQAAQFVQSGNADAGIIPLSLARSDPMRAAGRFVVVPPALYPPIEQAGIVLRTSRQKAAARAFLEFLARPDSIAMLADAGFGPAPALVRR